MSCSGLCRRHLESSVQGKRRTNGPGVVSFLRLYSTSRPMCRFLQSTLVHCLLIICKPPLFESLPHMVIHVSISGQFLPAPPGQTHWVFL